MYYLPVREIERERGEREKERGEREREIKRELMVLTQIHNISIHGEEGGVKGDIEQDEKNGEEDNEKKKEIDENKEYEKVEEKEELEERTNCKGWRGSE